MVYAVRGVFFAGAKMFKVGECLAWVCGDNA